ncbi:MAG: helix-turn-helix transcriptional regulator [Proteiniphilum sp.]|nr:helix-turn-helix transcriptional regulator [Proteiniphilum sp.]
MVYFVFTVFPLFVVFFWLTLFLLDETRERAKRFLTVFLSVAMVNYVAHWFYFNHNYEVYKILDSVWVFTSLSVYPLYYYYLRLLTTDTHVNKRWGWILMPALLLSLFSAILYLVMTPEESDLFVQEVLYHNRDTQSSYTLPIRLQIQRIHIFQYLFVVQVVAVVVKGIQMINRFNEKVRTYYSNVHHKELRNLRLLLLFLVVTSAISLLSNLIGKNFFTEYPYLLAIPSITHSLALFGVSYAGYRQHFTIRELTREMNAGHVDVAGALTVTGKETSKENSVERGLRGREYDHLFEKLEQMMQEDMLYLNPELRLNELANLLGTNRTYVSRLIHNRRNLNFCDYVNDYRIEHAKKILSASHEVTPPIDEVALQSGFSNNSTFYRVFTGKVGVTPSRFRKLNGN